MSYCTIQGATITVSDIPSLLSAWRYYGKHPCLVRTFRFEGKLTPSQLRRLPKGLQEKLKTDDSVAWLEALYGLDSGERESIAGFMRREVQGGFGARL